MLCFMLRSELSQKSVNVSALSIAGPAKESKKEVREDKPRNLLITKAPEDIQSRFPIIKLLTNILNVSVL